MFFLLFTCFALNKDNLSINEKPRIDNSYSFHKFCKALKKKYPSCSEIKVSSYDDPEYSPYLSCKYINKSIFTFNIYNEEIKITIETYENSKGVDAKKRYLNNINTWLNEEYPADQYRYLNNKMGLPERTYTYSECNALFIFHEPISSKVRDQFIFELKNIIDDIEFKQKNIPDNNAISHLNNVYDEMLDNVKVNINKNEINNKLSDYINRLDKEVTMAYISYSQKMIDDVRRNIKAFNFTALDATYKKWESMLEKSET